MQTIAKYLAILTLILSTHYINAQDTINNSKSKQKIETLLSEKEQIQNEERNFLKMEV